MSGSSGTVLNVAVLAGGESDEREISLKSGLAVVKALETSGHTPLHLDPALVDPAGVDWNLFDVAFIALHGRFGEDGGIQRILEQAGIPYTGSDSRASQIAFSKWHAKERFWQTGTATPPGVMVHYSDDIAELEKCLNRMTWPLVIKPEAQGSSFGVSLVTDRQELHTALQLAFQFDAFAIVEEAMLGQEWTVAVLDGVPLPPLKIHAATEMFDYQSKYISNETLSKAGEWDSPNVTAIAELAVRATCALGTAGLARVDIREDTAGRPWVLEVNTIPGMTDHSLAPKAARAAGIEFPELCDRIMASAIRRQQSQATRREPHTTPSIVLRRAG